MKLSINIDHVATLRNARGEGFPDPVEAAAVCEKAGADGIVCHLREDRRHIKDDDVRRLRKSLTTKLDLEMAATREIVGIAVNIKPDLVTLVPERRQELTTEGGLDVVRVRTGLRKAIARLHDGGIPVSLFIDPVKEQVDASQEVGAEMIEIHTGEYALAKGATRQALLKKTALIARYALKKGLHVNAGHGLDYSNIEPFVKIKEIQEVSIGFAVIARALEVGLSIAVSEMKKLTKGGK